MTEILAKIPGGVISLQYADDTILFVDKDITYVENLKRILTCFELMSGMRVNYLKKVSQKLIFVFPYSRCIQSAYLKRSHNLNSKNDFQIKKLPKGLFAPKGLP